MTAPKPQTATCYLYQSDPPEGSTFKGQMWTLEIVYSADRDSDDWPLYCQEVNFDETDDLISRHDLSHDYTPWHRTGEWEDTDDGYAAPIERTMTPAAQMVACADHKLRSFVEDLTQTPRDQWLQLARDWNLFLAEGEEDLYIWPTERPRNPYGDDDPNDLHVGGRVYVFLYEDDPIEQASICCRVWREEAPGEQVTANYGDVLDDHDIKDSTTIPPETIALAREFAREFVTWDRNGDV